ncbi:hypothetical protein I317_01275 [Kwoniella heveanensis CBS 569]|nr:hypothetical protein I317_01275 [Kwoniella heveanensis CBS 569]
MCTIISEERRYIHGRRRAHRALFDHIVPGISPTHLCLESYLWWDHFYQSDLSVRRWYGQLVDFLFDYLSRHWTLDSISMHRLAGYEEITRIVSTTASRVALHFESARRVEPDGVSSDRESILAEALRTSRRKLVRKALTIVNRVQQEDLRIGIDAAVAVQPIRRSLIIGGDTSFVPIVVEDDLPPVVSSERTSPITLIPTSLTARSTRSPSTQPPSVQSAYQGSRRSSLRPNLSWIGAISGDPTIDQRLREMIEVRDGRVDGARGAGRGGCQCWRDSAFG